MSRKMDAMKEKKKMTVISVDVTEELRDKVRAAAAAEELPMSIWIRRTLDRSATAKLAARERVEEIMRESAGEKGS